jgi:hypothetical protein
MYLLDNRVMKRILYMALSVPVFLTACSPVVYTSSSPQPVYNDQQMYASQQQTDQVFYDELSPYGNWIDYPDYGYVWQPDVNADFRPYATAGNWVYTDYGWTWVSDYSWGWAPFHYGRWFYDGGYGWLWTPGQQWAPAWVTWGQSGDYYGWAAIPPGADMNGGWQPHNEDWNFVPAQNITRTNVYNYAVRNSYNVVNNTRIINNINTYTAADARNGRVVAYNRGPRVNDVESVTNNRIQPVRVNGSARPGQSFTNNQLNVYRPDIKSGNASGNNRPAPQRVAAYKNVNYQIPSQPQNQQNRTPANGQGAQYPNRYQQNPQQVNGQNADQPQNHYRGQQNPQQVNGQNAGQQQSQYQQQNPQQVNGQSAGQQQSQYQQQNLNKPPMNRAETEIPANQHNNGQGNGQNQNQQQQAPRQGNVQSYPNPNVQQNQQVPRQGNGQGNNPNQEQLKKNMMMDQNPPQQPVNPPQQRPNPQMPVNPVRGPVHPQPQPKTPPVQPQPQQPKQQN